MTWHATRALRYNATTMPLDRITIFCFAASYSLALLLELLEQFRSRPAQRILATVFGVAGLLAHTLFLGTQRPGLSSQFGTLLFLSWALAVFYLYGSLHHRKQAWGLFVLPVILVLITLAALQTPPAYDDHEVTGWSLAGTEFWRTLHVGLFLLASIGLCVGFVASVMYLVQAHRLRSKALPGPGLGLLSLERLEAMNRRALTLGFSMLTLGILVSLARMVQEEGKQPSWTDLRVILTSLLWLVSILVLSLRYALHLRGRKMAFLTILAFALLLVTLVTAHGGNQ